MRTIKRGILIIWILSVALPLCAFAQEQIYTAIGNAGEILDAVSYTDSASIQNLAAVEDAAALSMLYGGGKDFEPDSNYPNSSALRLVYRTVGREKEGFEAAANSEYRARAGLGAYDDTAYADGFYLLALHDGLLAPQQFVQAFSDPQSEFSKTRFASVQNFIRWMCQIHGVQPGSNTLPENTYVDPDYIGYYRGALSAGVLSAEQVKKYAAWRYITKSDLADILKSFESRILTKNNVELLTGTVSQINISRQKDGFVKTVTLQNGETSAVFQTTLQENMPVFAQIEREIPVLGKARPDTSGSLRMGDAVSAYIKNGGCLFMRVTNPVSTLEYVGGPLVYKGTLYLYDYTNRSIVLDNVQKAGRQDEPVWGYHSFYTDNLTQVYYKGEPAELNLINTSMQDRYCFLYVRPDYEGGLERVCSVVIE